MKTRPKAPAPALIVAVIALFVGLSGGAAMASRLISGRQIVNHSIAPQKFTSAAVEALHGARGPAGPKGDTGAPGPKGDPGPQGPGAISINQHVPADGVGRLLTTIDGVEVFEQCYGFEVMLQLRPHAAGDTVFASGDEAIDGVLTSVQETGFINAIAASTANLDVVAWSGSDGTLSRFDLGGYDGGLAGGCNIWGLITPGSRQ